MIKILLFQFTLTVFSVLPLMSLDLSGTASATKNAFSVVPAGYEYYEESGALIFKMHKIYHYDILEIEDNIQQIVTYSSTENEKIMAEDPRPPIKEGQLSPFSMKDLLAAADVFRDDSAAEIIREKAVSNRGEQYRLIELIYTYVDEEDQQWPMAGELLIYRNTGVPVSLKAEQTAYPEDIYSFRVDVDFSGRYTSTCRIDEYRTEQIGQYGIFRYFFNTTRSFN